MVFNFADDSRNLVFYKGSSSISYEQEGYFLFFKSKFNNKYLKNITPTSFNEWDGQMLWIKLTKVDDNDTYVSFSWDSSNIDGFGTALPSDFNKEDIGGYYDLEVRGSSFIPVFTKPLITRLCKVINDFTNVIDTTNKATRIQEDGAEYTYYRG
jgi:hypothetical protein